MLSMTENPVSLLPYRRTWATMKGIEGVYQNPSAAGDEDSLFNIIDGNDWQLFSGAEIMDPGLITASLAFPLGSVFPGNILFGSIVGTVTPGTDNTGYTTQYRTLVGDADSLSSINNTLVRGIGTGSEQLTWAWDIRVQFAPVNASTWTLINVNTFTVVSSGGTLIQGPQTVYDLQAITYSTPIRIKPLFLFDNNCDTTCIITIKSAYFEMI
jgi:hypothetical protein